MRAKTTLAQFRPIPSVCVEGPCGGDKQSLAVLAVKANTEKLPPKVIFKGVPQHI